MDEFTIASDDEIEPEVLSDREEDVERRKDVISQKFNFEDEVWPFEWYQLFTLILISQDNYGIIHKSKKSKKKEIVEEVSVDAPKENDNIRAMVFRLMDYRLHTLNHIWYL